MMDAVGLLERRWWRRIVAVHKRVSNGVIRRIVRWRD